MLTNDERTIWNGINCLKGNVPEHTISGLAGGNCQLTAKFLREVLTKIFSEQGLIIGILTVKNISLAEDLDLRGVTTKSAVVFLDCQFQRTLRLSDASFRSLYFRGGTIRRIEGTRVRLSGSFDMYPNSPAGSEDSNRDLGCTNVPEGLELSGSDIGGNLDLRCLKLEIKLNGGRDKSVDDASALRANGITVRGNLMLSRSDISHSGGCAISLAGAHIKGDLTFASRDNNSRSECKESIRLSAATIDGNLDLSSLTCNASRNDNKQAPVGTQSKHSPTGLDEAYCYAIDAQGITIGGTLRLDGLVAYGPLSFVNATIGGSITGTNVTLNFPAAHAFLADHATVTGSVYLSDLTTSGILRFVQSTLSGGLYMKTVTFEQVDPNNFVLLRPTRLKNWRGPMRGLVADRATIKGGFELEDLNPGTPGTVASRIALEGASVSRIDDETVKSLRRFDFVHLLDCNYYSTMAHTAPSEQGNYRASAPSVAAWLEILDREYAPMAAKAKIPRGQNPSTDPLPAYLKYPTLPFNYQDFNRFVILIIFIFQILKFFLLIAFFVLCFLFKLMCLLCGGSNAPCTSKSAGAYVFHPQPYLHLARKMREAGFDRHASDILVAMEWRRTWYGDLSAEAKAFQILKGYSLVFGFNRVRPLYLLFSLAIFSSFVFQYAYEKGAIIPAKTNQLYTQCVRPDDGEMNGNSSSASEPNRKALPTPNCLSNSYGASDSYVKFNGLLFAFDAILPLTDLGQRKNWIIEPISGSETALTDPSKPQAAGQPGNVTSAQTTTTPAKKTMGGFLSAYSNKFTKTYLRNWMKTISFHMIAILFLVDVVSGSILTGLFIAGLSGIISNRY